MGFNAPSALTNVKFLMAVQDTVVYDTIQGEHFQASLLKRENCCGIMTRFPRTALQTGFALVVQETVILSLPIANALSTDTVTLQSFFTLAVSIVCSARTGIFVKKRSKP